MDNLLVMEMQQALRDLVDDSARLIVVKTSAITFNVRGQVSSCNKVLDDVAKVYYSATGRQLVDSTYMVLSVWKTCSTLMMLGYGYVSFSSMKMIIDTYVACLP